MLQITCAVSPEHHEALILALQLSGIDSFVEGSGALTLEPELGIATFYIADDNGLAEKLALLREHLGPVAVSIERSSIEDRDWQTQWQKDWQPSKIEKGLVICPAWIDYRPVAGERVLKIDPGMAFGTGTHQTTRMCLSLLMDLAQKRDLGRVLDVGSGTGVLSIAAECFGATDVWGIDISEDAVTAAEANAKLNHCSKARFSMKSLAEVPGQFDLVLANILSGIISELWTELVRKCDPSGWLILSGILVDEEKEFFEQLSIKPREVRKEGEWLAALIASCDLSRKTHNES